MVIGGPYLKLMSEAAPQRQHSLRELFNGLRYMIGYGIARRRMICRLGLPYINNRNAVYGRRV